VNRRRGEIPVGEFPIQKWGIVNLHGIRPMFKPLRLTPPRLEVIPLSQFFRLFGDAFEASRARSLQRDADAGWSTVV